MPQLLDAARITARFRFKNGKQAGNVRLSSHNAPVMSRRPEAPRRRRCRRLLGFVRDSETQAEPSTADADQSRRLAVRGEGNSNEQFIKKYCCSSNGLLRACTRHMITTMNAN